MKLFYYFSRQMLCSALMIFSLVPSRVLQVRAKPFNANNTDNNNNNNVRGDVNPFPTSITTVAPTDSVDESCSVMAVDSDGRVIRRCCDGYTGVNCDERVTEPPPVQVEYDPMDPCKNLVCEGVSDAQCVTVSKCGERWPVFMHTDGSIADCTNGQPINVSQLMCSARCPVDICAGATCAARPEAFCTQTVCNCDEPIWLLATGVQVDCDTGEEISPEEAKNRRRRRRQTVDQQQSQCT